jgi:hypothetical protein
LGNDGANVIECISCEFGRPDYGRLIKILPQQNQDELTSEIQGIKRKLGAGVHHHQRKDSQSKQYNLLNLDCRLSPPSTPMQNRLDSAKAVNSDYPGQRSPGKRLSTYRIVLYVDQE